MQSGNATPQPAQRGWKFKTLCAVTSLVALVLASCGGGSGSSSVGASGTPPVNNQKDSTLAASKPGELVAYFQVLLRQRVSQGGNTTVFATAMVTGAVAAAPAPAAAANDGAPRLAASGTTVQEAGVDEEDWLKTDGNSIYSLVRSASGADQLLAHSRSANGSVTLAASLALATDTYASGMLYAPAAQRIALLGAQTQSVGIFPGVGIALPAVLPAVGAPGSGFAPYYAKPQITLGIVNTSAAGTLSRVVDIKIDGSLVGSRLIGNTLYLVSHYVPILAADALPLLADRQAAISNLRASDLLPTLSVGDVTETLVKDTDCYVQSKNAAQDVQITSITAIDLASSTLARSSRCFAGGSEAIYVSLQSIYLATTRYAPFSTPAKGAAALVYAPNISTDIHKFAIQGLSATYQGSGNVPGHLGWDSAKKSYRMDEFNGDLRVLSFTGERGWGGDIFPASSGGALPIASPATLTVLRESSSTLAVVGSLPNATRTAAIGMAGEQVYAVRFMGARAYVVTFRRTDPLYVLDLANPADPLVAGELKAPGFSDYLIPLSDALLLGVGKDASDAGFVQGVKLALFDVSNPSTPKELAQRLIGKRGSTSALDYSPHGINVLHTSGIARIALPIRVNSVDYTPGIQALHRYEVDLASKQLVDKPMAQSADFTALGANAAYGLFDMARERSVQIGEFFYHLSGGALKAGAW